MSLHSMTGFGRSTFSLAGTSHSVEIRSVNHRYLDIKVRLPRALVAAEPVIRERVAKAVSRGRVEIVIQSAASESQGPSAIKVDLDVARSVVAAHQTLSEALGLEIKLDTHIVTQWPGVLVPTASAVEDTDLGAVINPAVDVALAAVVVMRTTEGQSLAMELNRRLDTVAALRETLEAQAPEQARAYRKRLEQRIQEMVANTDVSMDEGRVLHEVAILAERTDVAEEIARLGSHVDQARAIIATPAKGEGVGRRLDFMFQEMFREANTIASKANDLRVSESALTLKAELERLREQVQNVE